MSQKRAESLMRAACDNIDCAYNEKYIVNMERRDSPRINADQNQNTRKLLPDGFGFTADTFKFRLPEYQPRNLISCLSSLPRNNPLDSDLEQDFITVQGIVRKTLSDGSTSPDDFICNSAVKKTKLVGKAIVHIPHLFAGRLEYDEFGAEIHTYKAKERDGTVYYRHFLVKVQPDGPAEQIGIENNDEIVLLSGAFVPDVQQEEVLKLFHKVKVDGKTRFVLVIRRKSDQWIWMELSAVLAPETGRGDHPTVEQPRCKTLSDNCHQYSDTPVFYKVPGTQLYLQISNRIISVDTMKPGSNASVIWKRVFVCQPDETGEYKFEASLSDETRKLYITIDKNKNIVLNSEPQRFQLFGAEADKVRFRSNETYLGYDRVTKQVRAQLHDCVFEEFPAKNFLKIGQSADQRESSTDKVDGIVQDFYNRFSPFKRNDDFDMNSELSLKMICESTKRYRPGQ